MKTFKRMCGPAISASSSLEPLAAFIYFICSTLKRFGFWYGQVTVEADCVYSTVTRKME